MTTGHSRILALSIACILWTCLVDSASAHPQASRAAYTFCLSHPTPPDTSYFSGIFVIDPSIDGDARTWNAESQKIAATGHGGPPPAPWVEQFDQFLTQTYSRTRKGAGSCNSFATLAEAQKRLDEVIQSEQNFKYKVVETNWKYNTAHPIAPPATVSQPVAAAPIAPPRPPTATPPVAPAASPAPVAPRPNVSGPHVAAAPIAPPLQATSYAVCWSESPVRKTAYFGVPFPAVKVDNQAWAKEYRDFLTTKYGRVGLISCRTLKSLPEAQQQVQTWMDTARARDTLVETGWKFQ
jgi:hypothetical protein